MHIEARHVGMDRDQVVGEVVVDDPAQPAVHDRRFVQRQADAPDQAADMLAFGQQRI